jgi:hypothetical protein
VIEVVRHADGTLWVFWRVEGKDPRLDFPTGPRCSSPEEDNALYQRLLATDDRLRTTAQVLIEAVGAEGPCDAEDAAARAVEHLEKMTEARDALAAKASRWQEEYDHLKVLWNEAAAVARKNCPTALGEDYLIHGVPRLASLLKDAQIENERLRGVLQQEKADRERAWIANWRFTISVESSEPQRPGPYNRVTAIIADIGHADRGVILDPEVPLVPASDVVALKAEVERLQGALDAEKAYYACLQGEFNRAVALAQEHCPKPELGQSWLMAGIPLLAQRAAALEVEVARLQGELSDEECDAAYWREQAAKAAARERAAIVAWLRRDENELRLLGMRTLTYRIELGEHWPTEEKP